MGSPPIMIKIDSFTQNRSMQRNSLDAEMAGGGREDEQDGLYVQSPCRAAPSSASSLRKEQTQVDLEIKLLEALAIYPPAKLRGMHRHFVIYGIMEYLQKSFGRYFSPSEVLQLLDRFYDLEMLKPDEDDAEVLNQEEEFSLPSSYFVKDESRVIRTSSVCIDFIISADPLSNSASVIAFSLAKMVFGLF